MWIIFQFQNDLVIRKLVLTNFVLWIQTLTKINSKKTEERGESRGSIGHMTLCHREIFKRIHLVIYLLQSPRYIQLLKNGKWLNHLNLSHSILKKTSASLDNNKFICAEWFIFVFFFAVANLKSFGTVFSTS